MVFNLPIYNVSDIFYRSIPSAPWIYFPCIILVINRYSIFSLDKSILNH